VQAVWDRDLGGRSIAASPGNLYSKPERVNPGRDLNRIFKINCDQKVAPGEFAETEYIKELRVPSNLLHSFDNRVATIDAAVILPEEYYREPKRLFPVLFKISGYDGDYHRYSGKDYKSSPVDSASVITVFLDGSCRLGHSVYANSDNNGPWGDALVEEFIPALAKKFRCNGARLIVV
jgi:hypothetical protein